MHGNTLNTKIFIGDYSILPNVYTSFENESTPRSAGTVAPTNNTANFWYMGIASKSSTSVQAQLEVTTLAGGFTATDSNYYQFLFYKGELPTEKGIATLTRLGYVDATATVNTTGTKTVTIPLTTSLSTGDQMWFGLCLSATPVGALRSCNATNVYNTKYEALSSIGRRFGGTGTSTMSFFGTNTLTQIPWLCVKI